MGIWQGFLDSLKGLFEVSGLTALSWENYVMIGISYRIPVKKVQPKIK